MEQGKFVKLDENQEKHIRGGFSITADHSRNFINSNDRNKNCLIS
nr:hypothetical protein [Mycoplasmopsis bovis]